MSNRGVARAARVAAARVRWISSQTGRLRATARAHGWKAAVGECLASAIRHAPNGPPWASEIAREPSGPTIVAGAGAPATSTHPALTTSTGHEALVEALWLSNAPLACHPLVSVILPTADEQRLGLLRSAIESVLAQSYAVWELVVVDDSAAGMLERVPEWWPDDSRMTVVASGGVGSGAARNVGLDESRGDIVCYLDDDCRYFAWWLHAVVAAFISDANLVSVYGVRVVGPHGDQPVHTVADTFDLLTLQRYNPVDTNVLAHRRTAEARWATTAGSCDDYELAVALAAEPTRFLPLPACTYSTTSPNRKWSAVHAEQNAARVREVATRAQRRRPLRVLAHNGLYPQLSESYIGDELDALRRNGIDVALSREMPAWGGGVSRVPGPIHESLEDGIAAHDPDLVLVHWGQFAISIRDRLVAARMPYAVRTHSFDGGLGAADLIDEWCVGVWTPPGIDLAHPSAHQLATLIVDPPDGVADDELRTGRLLSLSAALPKKGWPVLLDAVAMLPDTDLDVYMALTDGFPDVPETVMTLARERGLAIDLRVDVPFDVAQDAVRRAGAIVYAIRGDQHIGQPRSVIEAALAGTPLVVPEHPMFTALLGRTCHTYRRDDPRSLAAAIDDALHRPHPLGARRDLARRVAHGHASQAVFADWADSLTDAFVDWRRVRRDGRLGAVTSWWSSELRRRLAI